MRFLSLITWPKVNRQRRSKTRQRRSFVPRLEILEDRTVLSTLTVLNNLDSGAGSLRDMIKHASDGDTIVFAPSLNGQTITLTSDQLTINKSLDIEGPGESLLAVSGNDTNRVFNINEGYTVTIAGLTITHGQAGTNNGSDVGSGGGGILNAGSTLTVANDVLSYNEANDHGGAISNLPRGVLTAIDSTFIGNQAIGRQGALLTEGGAIWNSSGDGNSSSPSAATVIGCTFTGNHCIGGNGGILTPGQDHLGVANGGAIHNNAGATPSTLTVENSTFTGNQAIAGSGGSGGQGATAYVVDAASGGGIANDDGGVLVVNGCTFSYNQAIGGSNASAGTSGSGRIGHALGGGVNNQGVATLTNSRFDHNEALGGSGNTGGSGVLIIGRGVGGGISNNIFAHPVTLTVSNCTFTNNQAVGGARNTSGAFAGAGVGGGIESERGATAAVTGSTFTGNQAIGGAGGAGDNGGDGLGGGIANFFGATLTVSNCTLTANQAVGGAGGVGANGGNGFGGGIFNDGLSIAPANAGTPATLTILSSMITTNQATGGAAGAGGSAGLGEGGGAYFASGGIVCLDLFTSMNMKKNTASTSNNDVFGVFTICP